MSSNRKTNFTSESLFSAELQFPLCSPSSCLLQWEHQQSLARVCIPSKWTSMCLFQWLKENSSCLRGQIWRWLQLKSEGWWWRSKQSCARRKGDRFVRFLLESWKLKDCRSPACLVVFEKWLMKGRIIWKQSETKENDSLSWTEPFEHLVLCKLI